MVRAVLMAAGALLVLGHTTGEVARAEDYKAVVRLAREGYWGKQQELNQHLKVLGQKAPELKLGDWRGGPVTAEQMKGNVVIVDFWATWCESCKKTVPALNEIAKKYKDRVIVVGACAGGNEEAMWGVAEEWKMTYPTGKASEETAKAWGALWYPHYVVVDGKGTIRALGVTPAALEPIIEALLK
ncbi:MAG: TlpA family protein disulfide reductase [Phycisphaerae bacterium]|nr:TlpA disulfide reductase family protein [Tepidisphaeraceae bacterium]